MTSATAVAPHPFSATARAIASSIRPRWDCQTTSGGAAWRPFGSLGNVAFMKTSLYTRPVGHHRIAIIGTGFAGLGMAIRLRQAGVHDFVVFERADDVGGTWRDNQYPGCQCDVPSHLYSLSFAPNPEWTRTFSFQPEIWDYLRRVARDHGVLPYVRFEHEVQEATWDDDAKRWRLETSQGPYTADVVVAGMGGLSEPRIPDIPGLENFEGPAFHSAQWDHSVNLTGKRVAVVGTGASAIQIVPGIQPKVAELQLYQRTPAWIMPHPDRPITAAERRVYKRLPALQKVMRGAIYWARESFVFGFMRPRLQRRGPERIARAHLAKQVKDPELRRKLTPDYTMGCKRVLLSNDYYPALANPNVEVVTEGIREIRANSIVAADGTERPVDVIVLGTGFKITDQPATERVRGRDGRLLGEHWTGSPRAHNGTAIPGFPNLFMLLGPNTGLGHNSVVFMIESQIAYVMDCLRQMDDRRLAAVEVREEAEREFSAAVDAKMRGTVWMEGGCKSWYLDANGRNSTLWPGTSWSFHQRTRRFDLANYDTTPAVTARPAEEAVSA